MVVHQALERAYSTELWSYVFILLIGGLIYILSDYLKSAFLCLRINGPKALPIIGNCMMAVQHNLLSEEHVREVISYGPLARIWLLFFPIFIVYEPHDLQSILSSKKHTEKMFFYKLLHNFLGNGLITSSGVKWETHRKFIQPSFHLNILEKFVGTFADSSDCLLEKLKEAPSDINITLFVNNCILDILNEAVLGVPVKRKNRSSMEESPFRQGKVVAPYRVTRPWLLFNWVYQLTDTAAIELNQKKNLDNFTKKMIQNRRDAKERGEVPDRKSLLDFMIEISENHPDFTEEDIINEACTFMLAGQDSVGAGVAFCIFLLAQHQEDQQKCINEIDDIFQDDDRSPTMHDLREMKYLEMCIKETLRLYPSVPMIARKITEDIPVSKHVLPTNSDVFIIPYLTHRLPHIYPEPEKFDPERFTPENSEKRHPYAYLPFSAGPRNCIGYKFAILEMKTVISKILRHYQLMPIPGKTVIDPSFRITVRARGGLWVRLEPRVKI